MADYPHLRLPFKVEGIVKPIRRAFNNEANENTVANKQNRGKHGEKLKAAANETVNNWQEKVQEIENSGIKLPNSNDIPIFLKIDTSSFLIDSLANWGIEVISEEEEGYIIGVSIDQFNSFKGNIDQFLNNKGTYKDTAAKIWEFITDDNWRISQLLKGEIEQLWPQIQDDKTYIIELSVACYVHNTKLYPNQIAFDSEAKFLQKVAEYDANEKEIQIARDQKQILRENEIEMYIHQYGGILHSIWDNEIDAIYFKISINGKGLKDLVHTYQYAFEVKLASEYNIGSATIDYSEEINFEIISPDESASPVCIIDSGIQENHRLLAPAILQEKSKSYVDGDESTADLVRNSGHGTKVAGALLYPFYIPKNGTYKFNSKILNAKILDSENKISDSKFAPELMQQIVDDFSESRIFNLSVAEKIGYNGSHMPALAASIDKIMNEKDVLFIVSAGNVPRSTGHATSLGVQEYIYRGDNYPTYLDYQENKISNPGVSYFSITVGSIAMEDFEDPDSIALAGSKFLSPFSRTGLGMWGCMKPDVVEFGGDFIINKNSGILSTNETVSPELVNSTLHGASATGKDDCGTSFSTPKVSYIASMLQNEHPEESAQMYRALIIQSARLPEHCFENPTLRDFQFYGYGMPDVNRALNNSPNRITFIQSGHVNPKKADIYRLIIPEELRGEGKEFSILVEVTLSFTSKTRSTRKGSHSYLANWLEWQSSKYNESFNSFRNRTIEYLEEGDEFINIIDTGANAIRWCLRENPAYTQNEINRNNSTVQKSWAIIQPHQFNDEFSIAIIGHVGWDKNLKNEIPYSLCVSFEALNSNLNIYNILAEAQVAIGIELETEIGE